MSASQTPSATSSPKNSQDSNFLDKDFSVGQSLSSILNNPKAGKSRSLYGIDAQWQNWMMLSGNADGSNEVPPPIPAGMVAEVSMVDFEHYLKQYSELHSKFKDVRDHFAKSSSSVEAHEPLKLQGEGLSACLREVPPLYFDSNFKLEDGTTFQAVCPFDSITSNMMLQEKLSYYLDLVESHLVQEISLRSDDFFAALAHLEDLHGSVADACAKLYQMKCLVNVLEEKLVEAAKKIHFANARRDNILALEQKLKLISYVENALSTLRLLLAQSDCASALDVIDDLRRLQEGDELAGLHCFRQLSSQLAQASETIHSSLLSEFLAESLSELQAAPTSQHVLSTYQDLKACSWTQTKLRLTQAMDAPDPSEEGTATAMDGAKERLLPSVVGLLRTAQLSSALRSYRESLVSGLKQIVKSSVGDLLPLMLDPATCPELPTAASESSATENGVSQQADSIDGEGGPSLASKLRSLSPDSFLHLLLSLFFILKGPLAGSHSIHWAISDIVEHTPLPSLSEEASKQAKLELVGDSLECVGGVVEAGQGRWAKLLGVRAGVHAQLELRDFWKLYHVTSCFLQLTEKLSGKLGYTLRGTLQSQAKSFVEGHHSAQVARIVKQLDSELWAVVDAPPACQRMVDQITADEGSFRADEDDSGSDPGAGTGPGASLPAVESSHPLAPSAPEKKPSVKALLLRGVEYRVVASVVSLVGVVHSSLRVSAALPSLTVEVSARLAQALQAFNSRSCQLVLGAGAMQVAGLRSITAKHLALASQATSLLHHLIPDIRRQLSAHVPPSRKLLLLNELDRVAQDYLIHRDEIHTKLVAIMRERLAVHIRSIPGTLEAWEGAKGTNAGTASGSNGTAPVAEEDEEASQYARALTKEVGVLLRILSPLLLESDIASIFTRVADLFHPQLADAFSKAQVTSTQGRKRMFRDVQHILKSIDSLPRQAAAEDRKKKPRELEAFLKANFPEGLPS